jgi:hypothetical protein
MGMALCVGSLIAMFAVVSVVAGRPQPVSYLRTSTFFVPLLLLFGAAVCGWVAARVPTRGERWLLAVLLPLMLLVGTASAWLHDADWRHRLVRASGTGLRFLVGGYSLAEGYSRQDGGLPGGAIDPHALAAWRHVERGAPIWSTHVNSYCMAPDCWIESVSSFKLSGRLDEIVTGTPDRAKQLLQEAGLNYFLVSSDLGLLDILPYSNLFAPDTIGRYLVIKWTDGSAFLLTWLGPGTTPLTPEFLAIYAELRNQPENQWFQFSRLAPQFTAATDALRAKAWGAAPDFPWRRPAPAAPEGTIDIAEATYGQSCAAFTPRGPIFNTVYPGNATETARQACSGKADCDFRVDVAKMGDPASGCAKDFAIAYRCRRGDPPTTVTLPAEANGRSVRLSCDPVR